MNYTINNSRAPARLKQYKASAEKGAANHGPGNYYSDWRVWRHGWLPGSANWKSKDTRGRCSAVLRGRIINFQLELTA